MATWLSPHFTLEELTATQQRGLDNTPSAQVTANLRATAERMEAVRELLGGHPILVSSGYRSPAVNRAVGGAVRSAHLTGQAVDFVCHRFGTPKAICRKLADSPLAFDQLIEEGTWVHVSFDPRLRRQVLTKARGGGYHTGLR
ncbi:MAG: D-Ala-D-Ala carboxypeptidase family metallohydrolase [Phenylobacterium sp.]|jgi:zinc D-Ala-D-Ala carboxypeptidase|uniref:D-Ala-D-Ala carboxypeptidase family metallohydrolase n=1 Tax=Phenylobacterium sp. TaxID=1871053 RepID=UPI00391D6394